MHNPVSVSTNQSYLEGSTPSCIKKEQWPPQSPVVISWTAVYGTHFLRKFTAEGRPCL